MNSDSTHSCILWDIIVLTTFDDCQKKCFELLLTDLLSSSPFLLEKCHIIADPPQTKLGSGGSTLYALQVLLEKYGCSIYSKKIIIIHSGGSSQRLPSHSIQGKIFSPLPYRVSENDISSRITHMLDLKLSMYLPFGEILGPGVFVTCADDIETFYFNKDLIDLKKLKEADVVALGHPCDLKTATGHGVYVLPEASVSSAQRVLLSDCLEVLQKPSINQMKDKNAIYETKWAPDEMVYSDSAFWMSERVYRALLSWYVANEPLESELDAYGHFLPCFGTNIASIPQGKDSPSIKEKLFPILKCFSFKVLVLNESKFYHLGSMMEYVDYFTIFDQFIKELRLKMNTSNVSSPIVETKNNKWMIMYSHLSTDRLIRLTENVRLVMELCFITMPLVIEGDTILSNCSIGEYSDFKYHEKCITIPAGYLFHTAPIKLNKDSFYVTVAFEIKADMKRIFNSLNEITMNGVTISKIVGDHYLKTLASCLPCSLFSLPLFQTASTPQESFFQTLSLVRKSNVNSLNRSVNEGTKCNNNLRCFSMEEIINFKDVNTFFEDKKRLYSMLYNSSNF